MTDSKKVTNLFHFTTEPALLLETFEALGTVNILSQKLQRSMESFSDLKDLV